VGCHLYWLWFCAWNKAKAPAFHLQIVVKLDLFLFEIFKFLFFGKQFLTFETIEPDLFPVWILFPEKAFLEIENCPWSKKSRSFKINLDQTRKCLLKFVWWKEEWRFLPYAPMLLQVTSHKELVPTVSTLRYFLICWNVQHWLLHHTTVICVRTVRQVS